MRLFFHRPNGQSEHKIYDVESDQPNHDKVYISYHLLNFVRNVVISEMFQIKQKVYDSKAPSQQAINATLPQTFEYFQSQLKSHHCK